MLKLNILNQSKDNPLKTLMITSSLPGEGKTFIACHLAANLARGYEGQIYLIDINFRNPGVYKYFDIQNEKGLYEFLTEKAELTEIIRQTGTENLKIIPAGRAEHSELHNFSFEKIKNLIEELDNQIRNAIFILDTPGVEQSVDALEFAQFVDGVILVIHSKKTDKKIIKEAINKFPREKIIGLVLNQYNFPKKTYKQK